MGVAVFGALFPRAVPATAKEKACRTVVAHGTRHVFAMASVVEGVAARRCGSPENESAGAPS